MANFRFRMSASLALVGLLNVISCSQFTIPWVLSNDIENINNNHNNDHDNETETTTRTTAAAEPKESKGSHPPGDSFDDWMDFLGAFTDHQHDHDHDHDHQKDSDHEDDHDHHDHHDAHREDHQKIRQHTAKILPVLQSGPTTSPSSIHHHHRGTHPVHRTLCWQGMCVKLWKDVHDEYVHPHHHETTSYVIDSHDHDGPDHKKDHKHIHIGQDHDSDHGDHDHGVESSATAEDFYELSELQIWTISLSVVMFMSCLGFVAILFIPFMRSPAAPEDEAGQDLKKGHNHDHHHHGSDSLVIQFFVGLAIGTLLSDSLLHLLPHSFQGPHGHGSSAVPTGHGHDQDHNDHDHGGHDQDLDHMDSHRQALWVGIVTFLGAISLFLFEKLSLVIKLLIQHYSYLKRRVRSSSGPPRAATAAAAAGQTAYSPVPILIQEDVENGGLEPQRKDSASQTEYNLERRRQSRKQSVHSDTVTFRPTLVVHSEATGGGGGGQEVANHSLAIPTHLSAAHSMNRLNPQNGTATQAVVPMSRSASRRQLNSSHLAVYMKDFHHLPTPKDLHAHLHTCELAPIIGGEEDIAAAAAAAEDSHTISSVICGDALHNLCDGLAIGVAFTQGGLWGGLSTSIAILCHELPHEIGDFAVLLAAGCSVKRAILLNIVSSVFSLVGAVIGIFLGNYHHGDSSSSSSSASFTQWPSAAMAGMFLYIAFVNMVPHLTATSLSSSGAVDGTAGRSLVLIIIQFLGIFMGFAIMLVISLYE